MCPFLNQDSIPFLIMEDLDTRLFIAGVEVSSNMTQRSIFSINRTKYLSKPQAFAKVTYHGFFKCEGKCYPNT